MSDSVKKLPVTIMRGGTSKGVYILEDDMPAGHDEREPLLLRLMGSPDAKQIDGLGGSYSVTSKVAIIRKSENPEADVDYTFAQVSVDKPLVSYKGNCGNISSGVGPFAIERGLVEAKDGMTSVRIFNTNTNKIIVADVKPPGGEVAYSGDFAIAGVPGTASPVKLKFVRPSGTLGKGLLPTGNVVDTLDVPGFGKVDVSIADAANPLAFVKAADIGLTGKELPDDLSAKPENYTTSDGKQIAKENIDLLPRMMSMQKPHPSYAMTGAMCTAAAAVTPGSIVNQVLAPDADTQFIRIGHPAGILECGADFTIPDGAKVPEIDDTFGFFALGAAFVLGTVGGMKASQITAGFSSSMFVTLVGVTFMFGMASQNGTLELFSKKVVALAGKRTVLIPILMFVLSAFISAIGPGHIAAGILMTTFAMYLAFEMDINPMATR